LNGRFFVVVFVTLFGVLAVFNGAAWAGGNVNIMYGQKSLDEDDWDPVQDQREYGLMIDFKGNDNWPFSIALDFLKSYDDSDLYLSDYGIVLDTEGETQELDLGIRKYFQVTKSFKPYIGGGVAFISAEKSASYAGESIPFDGSGVGFWLSGGMVFTIAERFNIGVDLRYSAADATLSYEYYDWDVEAGGTHLLVFAGVHF
jgi:opacity protein-like surface antigen